MKRRAAGWVLGAGVLIATTGAAVAADKVDVGKSEYDVSCAVCHGLTGKGDGPYKSALTKAPTDLSQLAKKNGGVYPFERVYEVIDGRANAVAHGSREMPVWGKRYTVAAAEYYVDMPYDPEAYVRGRVLALTEYVYRLQAK
jgi:mono/diheme cytochrome c family protein